MNIHVETQLRRDNGAIENYLTLDDALEVLVLKTNPNESTLDQSITKISFGCFDGRVVLYSDGTWRFAK